MSGGRPGDPPCRPAAAILALALLAFLTLAGCIRPLTHHEDEDRARAAEEAAQRAEQEAAELEAACDWVKGGATHDLERLQGQATGSTMRDVRVRGNGTYAGAPLDFVLERTGTSLAVRDGASDLRVAGSRASWRNATEGFLERGRREADRAQAAHEAPSPVQVLAAPAGGWGSHAEDILAGLPVLRPAFTAGFGATDYRRSCTGAPGEEEAEWRHASGGRLHVMRVCCQGHLIHERVVDPASGHDYTVVAETDRVAPAPPEETLPRRSLHWPLVLGNDFHRKDGAHVMHGSFTSSVSDVPASELEVRILHPDGTVAWSGNLPPHRVTTPLGDEIEWTDIPLQRPDGRLDPAEDVALVLGGGRTYEVFDMWAQAPARQTATRALACVCD